VLDFVIGQDHPKALLDKFCHLFSQEVKIFVGRLVRAPLHGCMVLCPCPQLSGKDDWCAMDTDMLYVLARWVVANLI
jgi:hypothetical protein